MIKEAIGTGATLDEAKEAALKALEAPEDADIKYEVLERPQKKVLGLFGGSPAKVKACYEYEEVKADDFTAAKAYLNNILVNLGVNDAEIEIEADSEDVRINISCGDDYGSSAGGARPSTPSSILPASLSTEARTNTEEYPSMSAITARRERILSEPLPARMRLRSGSTAGTWCSSP